MHPIARRPSAAFPIPTARQAGHVVSAVVVLFFLADAASQLFAVPPVLAAAADIGFPASAGLWQAIGAVLLLATLLYAIPRTALYGAVLITGYLGGAICAHVRVGGEGVVAPTVLGLVLATLAWAGLALRDTRLRALVAGR